MSADPISPRTLRLTLKRRWFDMIAAGVKREEYREIGPWILSRLVGKTYDVVEFRNGYSPTSPVVRCHYRGWRQGIGQSAWGAGTRPVVIIELGEVIEVIAPGEVDAWAISRELGSIATLSVAHNDDNGNRTDCAGAIELRWADADLSFYCHLSEPGAKISWGPEWLRIAGIKSKAREAGDHVGNIFWNEWRISTLAAWRLITSPRFTKFFELESGSADLWERYEADLVVTHV